MSKHYSDVQKAIVEASKKLNVTPDVSGSAEQLAARLAALNAQLEFAPPPVGAPVETKPEVEGAPVETKPEVEGAGATLAETVARLEAGATETPVTDAVAAIVDVKEPYFGIAPGRAVTSLRGILAEGTPVTARDFINQESFQTLLDSKTVVEYK